MDIFSYLCTIKTISATPTSDNNTYYNINNFKIYAYEKVMEKSERHLNANVAFKT